MSDPITIRRATEGDRWALARLAALDEGPMPCGEALLALVGGEPRAALPLDGGRAVADPFHPTAALLSLLRMVAEQDGARREPPRRRAVLRLARA